MESSPSPYNPYKDDPITLLNKSSYKTIVMKQKAPHLNCLFKPICYTQENSYKIYKWIPNDPEYDMTNGKSGKRIMKIKEKSSMHMRWLMPSSCRGYEGQFQSENNRRIMFNLKRPIKCTFACFARPELSVSVVRNLKTKE